jgi:hypothetical protein
VSPWTFERVADLYAQGWTLCGIGAELGIPWTAEGHQLRRARPPGVWPTSGMSEPPQLEGEIS